MTEAPNMSKLTAARNMPPSSRAPVVALFNKEAQEILTNPRGRLWLLVLTSALSVYALLLVSNTELSLLDNAQVVYIMLSIVTALGALLAILTGVDTIAGEHERGALTPLLLTPLSRPEVVTGKLGGPVSAWAAMVLVSIPYLWAVGSTGQNLGLGVAALLLFGTPIALGFGFMAMGLGARWRSSRLALSVSLILFAVSASPLLLGPSLRRSAIGQMFDAINPISGAYNAYDALVIDSQTMTAQGLHALPVIGFALLAAWFAVAQLKRL